MLNSFRSNKNLSLLWEVLVEEKIINIESEKDFSTIYSLFENHIQVFCNENRRDFENSNLININKKFIKFVVPVLKEKKTLDTLFLKKQEEFQQFHQVQIPDVPELNNRIVDEPIKEMNELVEDIIKKRNLEFVYTPIQTTNNNEKKEEKKDLPPRLIIDDKPLENYTNKVIDLDKRVIWSDEVPQEM